MRKIILLAALTMPLMAGIMFAGYNSLPQEKKTAQTKSQVPKPDLNAAHMNTYIVAHQEATAGEWKKFNKDDFELKIKANETRISELNVKIRKSSGLSDPFSLEKIGKLEKENRFLKGRLEAYEKFLSNKISN
jgi:hypothetical protein